MDLYQMNVRGYSKYRRENWPAGQHLRRARRGERMASYDFVSNTFWWPTDEEMSATDWVPYE